MGKGIVRSYGNINRKRLAEMANPAEMRVTKRAAVDQNTWDDKVAQVVMNFQNGPVVYTPLIEWMDRSRATGADATIYTDMLDADVNTDTIAYDAMYIPEPLTVDSRFRTTSMARYGKPLIAVVSKNQLPL
jgi:hypothetical protein